MPGDILENSKYPEQTDMGSGPLQEGVVSLLQAELLQNWWTDKLQAVKGLTASYEQLSGHWSHTFPEVSNHEA